MLEAVQRRATRLVPKIRNKECPGGLKNWSFRHWPIVAEEETWLKYTNTRTAYIRHWRIQRGVAGVATPPPLIFKKRGHQRGRCDKHGVYSEWTWTERAGQGRRDVGKSVQVRQAIMQLAAYHVRRRFVQKTVNKVVYNDAKRLLFAYPFPDVAALVDLLGIYICCSSYVGTLHRQVHHNVTTSFSRNNLFGLFNKVPDLTTAIHWCVVCSIHDTQNISRYHLFSNEFMRFSMFLFRVHVSRPCGSWKQASSCVA